MNIDKQSLRLEDEHLYLRPLRIEDVTEEYVCGLNDPEVNRYLVDVRRKVQTYESVAEFVDRNNKCLNGALFGVFLKDDEKPFVGTVRVSNIDKYHYSASVGICMFAKRVWKRGYATRALEMVKVYLFEDLNLRYIEAGVYMKNTDSVALFKRAGFIGRYRVADKYRYDDGYEEALYFAAINPSFDMSLLKG